MRIFLKGGDGPKKIKNEQSRNHTDVKVGPGRREKKGERKRVTVHPNHLREPPKKNGRKPPAQSKTKGVPETFCTRYKERGTVQTSWQKKVGSLAASWGNEGELHQKAQGEGVRRGRVMGGQSKIKPNQ